MSYAILLFGSWGDKEREGGRGGAGKVYHMGIAGINGSLKVTVSCI